MAIRKKHLRLILLLLLAAAVAVVLFYSCGTTLTVIDASTGMPLPGAKITIRRSSPELSANEFVTNSEGKANLRKWLFFYGEATVEKDGYEPANAVVGSEAANYTIKIEPTRKRPTAPSLDEKLRMLTPPSSPPRNALGE